MANSKSDKNSLIDENSGLHYSTNEHKPGRPYILFVHGTPGDKNVFNKYLKDPELNAAYNMISIDRLGFGSSFNRKAVTTFKQHGKAILTFLKSKFPDQKIHCSGHSYGGPLCLYIMAWEPEMFGPAVLIAGAYNHERKILRWYNKFASNFFIKRIIPIPLRNSNDEMYGLKKELQGLAKVLPKIQSKVHLIHGKKDKIVPVGDSSWLYEKLSPEQRGQIIIEPKDGHFILWKNIKRIKQVIFEEVK